MSDRYVFAKADPDAGPQALHLTKPTDIPAPSPEDWQAIVDAVDVWESVVCDLVMGNTEEQAMFNAIATAAAAAVRNMREAEQ